MRKRDSLLGRARPAERLTREQIAALDKETSTPPAPPAPTKPTAPPPATQEPQPNSGPNTTTTLCRYRQDCYLSDSKSLVTIGLRQQFPKSNFAKIMDVSGNPSL